MLPVLALLLHASAVQAQPSAQAGQPAQGSGNLPAILILGDSLSAEYGLRRGSGWVALLEQRLAERRLQYRVVNASISGETTSGGAARLARLLSQHRPAIVVLELGANDALRGLSLEMTSRNLRDMTRAAKAAGARVLIVGMQIPPNYGPDYTRRFAALFETLAREERTALVPFLLEGIATEVSYFQLDRIHPNESAQPILLETVWKGLAPMIGAR
jgi:acyl-CoA thioesterase-1